MKKRYTLLLAGLAAMQTSQTFATNGYWSHGYGPKSKSMAGACVAMRFGAMCAASNPGSMVFVGERLELGLSLFSPKRGFTADNNAAIPGPQGPASIPSGSYDSENTLFLIPHIAYNHPIDSDNSVGISIGANGGMNTEYKNTAVFQNFAHPAYPQTTPSTPTGIDLKQAFAGVTYAHKLNENHGIGITPIFAMQTFKAQGLQPFIPFSKHPESVTNNGTDYSYGMGGRIGWSGQMTDKLRLGLSYQTKLYMTAFDDYKGLFAEDGDFDIPPVIDAGFAYDITPALTFSFHFQQLQFDKVKAIGNRSDVSFMPGQTLLGTSDGMGFGWDDMDIYKFGIQWQYSDDLTLRAGYSYTSDAFQGTQALINILAPAVSKRHYTFGLGKKMAKNLELNAAFMYSPSEKVYGTNPNTGPQTGFLEMDQWEIELGISKTF
jgi:long-chain fatty acid transport protein